MAAKSKIALSVYFALSTVLILSALLIHPEWPYLQLAIIGNALLIAWAYSRLREGAPSKAKALDVDRSE